MTQTPNPFGLLYLWQSIAFIFCLILIGLIFIIGGVCCWCLTVFLPLKHSIKQSRRLTSFVFKGYLKICDCFGLINIDITELDFFENKDGLIIAANHPSMIDVVLITSKIKNCTCIAKNTLIKNPILGMSARANAYISNDDLTQMIKQSVSALDAGVHVLVFPESTRTRLQHNLVVNPLGGSAALIAKRAKKNIQMIYIHTNSQFLGGEWPLFKRPQFPITYRITLGEQITPLSDLTIAVQAMQKAYQDNLRPVH
jgi:1-acyl-sn-glycerol-3-phosphate acyltransferase